MNLLYYIFGFIMIHVNQGLGPNLNLQSISLTHKLLDKLVKRENLNCLVVNLYRGNEGYSLAIKMSSGLETETVRLSYEEDTFLTYIGKTGELVS